MTTDTTVPADTHPFAAFAGAAVTHEVYAELLRHVRDSAPGIDDTTAERVLYLTLGAISVAGDINAGEGIVRGIIEAAVADKEPWAIKYLKAVENRKYEQYRTTYNEAVEIGLNPAGALRLTHKLDEPTAREAARYLKKTTPKPEQSGDTTDD
ncbi:hypothetical protein ACFU0X_10545 [Streptomyces cellulosae]|uniref:Uncharacterized protein n=1 Tax=Streptomyces cellulosae TaxID=1968 RepID=A0ABW6JG84_STRCE